MDFLAQPLKTIEITYPAILGLKISEIQKFQILVVFATLWPIDA